MLATGAQIAGYRVERVLGRGGMGTVYLATQTSLNRLVALKMLPREYADDVSFRARFAREGEVQAALDHPHIVPVFEAGESEQGLYLAMRYVRGPTLKDLILAGEMSPARAIRLLTPIAGALDAAHAVGLIHRDIKPQNILVDTNDWPYLADFGLTRVGGTAGLTRTGQLVGTFDYIAPEQVEGRPASAATDQYALTAVLFECVTGQVPYPRESDAALLFAQVHEDPPSLTDRAGDTPADLDPVIRRGMAKSADDRFPSAGAMMAAAAAAVGDAGSQAISSVTAAPILTGSQAAAPSAPSQTNGGAVAAPPGGAGRETVISPATTPARGERRPASRVQLQPRVVVPLVAGGLAILGFAAASSLSSDDGAKKRALKVGSAATLSIDDSARRADVPEGLGLDKARAHALGDARTLLVAGQGAAAGPTLLPAGALDDAARGRTPQPVKVGSAEGLRFDGLRVPGIAGRATVVAVPTATASAVAACAAGDDEGRRRCDAVLGSLAALPGARTVGVAPRAAYGRELRGALTRYNRDRARAQTELREARRSASQAAAARRLGSAAGTLAQSLRRLEPHPAAALSQARIASAASSVRDTARALARSAAREDRAGYLSARERLSAAEARLRREIASTKSLWIRS